MKKSNAELFMKFLEENLFHCHYVRCRYWLYSTAGASGIVDAPTDCWFVYTTRKVDGKFFVAHVSIKESGSLGLRKSGKSSVRWKARDKAYEWYCEIAGKPFATLHHKKKCDHFKKILCCIDNKEIEKFFDLNQEYIGQAFRGGTYIVENRFGKNMILSREKFEEKSNE